MVPKPACYRRPPAARISYENLSRLSIGVRVDEESNRGVQYPENKTTKFHYRNLTAIRKRACLGKFIPRTLYKQHRRHSSHTTPYTDILYALSNPNTASLDSAHPYVEYIYHVHMRHPITPHSPRTTSLAVVDFSPTPSLSKRWFRHSALGPAPLPPAGSKQCRGSYLEEAEDGVDVTVEA